MVEFGSGWLITGRWLCDGYITDLTGTITGTVGADSLNADITYQACDEWTLQLSVPAVESIRLEAAHIAIGTGVLMLRWVIIVTCIFLLARWLFRTLTGFKKFPKRRR